jgi:5,10-methylenetetrahydrofolate reductase
MSSFAGALASDRSLVTCELNPPKGTDLGALYEKASMLESRVDAFNVTDSAASCMAMAPIAAAHLLSDRGIEPILQITARNRNRLSVQSDLLAAAALGIRNVLCMSGDPPGAGDHPDAKTVFDIETVAILRAIASLRGGADMAGNELTGAPDLNSGAVANPGADDLDKELRRMEEKAEAGAAFFQTQAVYDPAAFETFMKAAVRFDVPVLAGLIVLKSARMARNLNANLPGVHVPDSIIAEMDGADSRREKSTEISARLIREISPMCRGVHIMAIGWESRVPGILDASGVSSGG